MKALLAILQAGVDEANQRLKVSETLQRQIIKLRCCSPRKACGP